jgi:tight adherence protein B
VQIIAVFFLASAAIGGVVYVFLYPLLSGERKAEQRIQSVAGTTPTTRATRGPQKSRRDAIESTLKDFDERHKKSKNVPLSARIASLRRPAVAVVLSEETPRDKVSRPFSRCRRRYRPRH